MTEEEPTSQKLPDTCPMSESSQVFLSQKKDGVSPWGRLWSFDAIFEPIDLTKSEYTVGRSPHCDFELRREMGKGCFSAFSKVHFRLKRQSVSNDDYVVYLEDVSRNGTFVNETKVGKGKTVVLENNDEISIIHCHLKVFVYMSLEKDMETKNYPEEVRRKYAISRVLGSGACGVVKLVYEKSTRKALAMKVVQKKRFRNEQSTVPDRPERLQREVAIMKALSHVFVIQFQNVIDSPDYLFIFTEYVEGGDMFDRVRSTLMSEREVKLYFYQLTLAIQYLHGKGIIHRDVKLENILLSSRTSDSIVKLSDFGYSRFLDSESSVMTFCGTPSYIAPEILKMRGKKEGTYDGQVDIWSMGVVLYACLCGQMPFAGKTRKALTDQILGGVVHFPQDLFQGISKNAMHLIRRMLTVNPKRRITIDGILNHPWLKDNFIEIRISRLLTNNELLRRGVVRHHTSDDEEEVMVKKAKLEEPTSSSSVLN